MSPVANTSKKRRIVLSTALCCGQLLSNSLVVQVANASSINGPGQTQAMATGGNTTIPEEAPTRIDRPGSPSSSAKTDGKTQSVPAAKSATTKANSASSTNRVDDHPGKSTSGALGTSSSDHAAVTAPQKKQTADVSKATAKNKSVETKKTDYKRTDGKTAENGSEPQAKSPTTKAGNAPPKSSATSNSSQQLLSSPQTPTLAPLTPTMAPTDGKSSQSASTKSSPNPSSKTGTADATADKTPAAPDNGPEQYPTVGKLESITFGAATPSLAIDKRLEKLETTVLKKNYPEESLFDRTERLKNILTGGGDEPPEPTTMMPIAPDGLIPDTEVSSGPGGLMAQYLTTIAEAPENQAVIPPEAAQAYIIELINELRQKIAMAPLTVEPIAQKIATEHVKDLADRALVSHSDAKGDNPDRRYTLAGGSGALIETLVTMSRSEMLTSKPTRASIAEMLKKLISHQDDREAMFNTEASEIGAALCWSKDGERLYGCTEIVTSRGAVEPVPYDVRVGDKIEVKGSIAAPYKFDKITIAWEGSHALGSTTDESQEALPYFPPLDYAAFQQKSEHDYSNAMTALKVAGIVAALAGGVFIPPVALAAPLIAMSGSVGSGEPKPANDIPTHGGVHVDSQGFSGRVPITNSNKEGIYYITVWASMGHGTKSIPISRRAIVASGGETASETVDGKVEDPKPKHKHEKKDQN